MEMKLALDFHREFIDPGPDILERLAICAQGLPSNFWLVHSHAIQLLMADELCTGAEPPSHIRILAEKLAGHPLAVDDYYSAPWFRFAQGQESIALLEQGTEPPASRLRWINTIPSCGGQLCAPMWQVHDGYRRISVPIHLDNRRSLELCIDESSDGITVALYECPHASHLPF